MRTALLMVVMCVVGMSIGPIVANSGPAVSEEEAVRLLSQGYPVAVEAKPKTNAPGRGYAFVSDNNVGGLWVLKGDSKSPQAALYSQRIGGQSVAVLGFNSDPFRPNSNGHDFAIVAEEDGVRFQIIDAKGKVHSIPVTALLKLAEK